MTKFAKNPPPPSNGAEKAHKCKKKQLCGFYHEIANFKSNGIIKKTGAGTTPVK